MKNRTVWKTRAARLALLAIAGCTGLAHAADARTLGGVWQCHFLETNKSLEKRYYSNWTFDAVKKEAIIMWSPVHNGKQLAYDWDGKLLVLDYLFDGKRPNYAKYKAEMNERGELIIETPGARWKGWLCQHAPSERWPEDKLQFLDYSRYPWLSGLIEDGPSIMEYRDPKRYEEWRKGRLRQ